MIKNGKGEFDQDVFILSKILNKIQNIFKIYNGSQCAMVLIKNVPITSKGDWYLRTQQYTIFTNIINETIWACLLKLHDKLSITRHTLNDVISYLMIYFF